MREAQTGYPLNTAGANGDIRATDPDNLLKAGGFSACVRLGTFGGDTYNGGTIYVCRKIHSS